MEHIALNGSGQTACKQHQTSKASYASCVNVAFAVMSEGKTSEIREQEKTQHARFP